MLVQLTAKRSSEEASSDPLEMLLACHERIRNHLALAHRLIDAVEPAAAGVSEAASALVRYFGQALPLHILDEDVTLLAALAARTLEPALRLALETMTAEHLLIEPTVEEALGIWQKLTAEPLLLATLREDLTRLTVRLRTLLSLHLEAEERQIFPAVAKLLTAKEREAMVERIRERRQAR